MKRNSSIELLRITCIYGIIIMHIWGQFSAKCSGINLIFGVGINSIFNMGVTLFMLITGYFGAKVNLKKILRVETTLWYYGILGVFTIWAVTSYWSFKDLFKALFPVATNNFWYMSVYMIILMLSGYLNELVEKLDRKKFEMLLLILVIFFYIMPTVFYYQIMEDSGKGLVNMLIVYLIGRYINVYIDDNKILKKNAFLIGGGAIGIGFCLNYFASLVLYRGKGLFAPFARDNSLIILVGSIGIFIGIKKIYFFNTTINAIAKSVLSIYIFEGTVRRVISYIFDWSKYENSCWLSLIVLGVALLIMCICFINNLIFTKILLIIEKNIYGKIEKRIESFQCYINKLRSKW